MTEQETSERLKELHDQLDELDEEHADLKKKALQAETHVIEATVNELRELHEQYRRTRRSISRLFSGPRR